MKAEDLRPCALCGQGVMHAGVPIFWRVSFRRMGVDIGAVRRSAGLEMVLGSVALARVMGPDEAIASPLADEHTILVCEQCASRPTSVYELGFPKDQQ
jgi:hypothetical protein